VVADDVRLPPPGPGGPALASPNDEMIRMARENPATVANVVRSWVNT